MGDHGSTLSHSTDIDSRSNPDGLQEIRSWASRSPDSVRPGFRSRSRSGALGRSSTRLAGSVLLVLLLLLLSAVGYRFFFPDRQAPSDLAAVVPEPEPEQVVPIAEENGEAPPIVEAVADLPQVRKEPIQASVTPPAPPMSEEIPRKEAGIVRREPAPKEPRVASQILVSRDAFESEPAVLLSVPTAEYPDTARGTGTSAQVIVGFTIDETGAVRDPAVESSRVQGDAPEALFVEEALAAARRARFVPARERGVPTRSWSTLTFSFESGPSSAGI